MKRKLQLIAFTFVATFLFTNLGFAQLVLQKGNGSVPAPTEKEDQWIHYDTGSNENSIGLNAGGLFDVAARWEPAELVAFEGYAITKLRMYIADVPTSTTAKIWQGADVESLDLMLSVFFEAPGDDWVEVELDEPYMIDTSLELWIGYQVDDPGEGVFAAGCDAATDFVGFGNKVKLGTDAWTDLSEFGIAGNWNLQAFVVEMAQTTTVVDIIVNSEDHTTLATAVTAAGLVDALSGEGPFTVFAPTNAAFDALPEGLLDALLADPEGDLTKVLLYHVVEGDVMSGDLTDGQVITTLLGQELTVTIDGGVFINDFAGNSVEVTVPDLEADNGVVHVVDGVLIPDLTVSTYDVTFNVDMNEVEGFDPEVHDVYIAGSFPGDLEWNEPGTNDDLKMQLVEPAKNDPPYTLYENWQEYDDFTTNVTPWIVHHINTDVTWGSEGFDFPGEGESFAWMVFNPSATEPAVDGDHPPVDGDKYLVAVQSQTPNDDKWLVTPEVSFDETSVFSFSAKSITDAYGLERIRILVSTTGSETADFTQISDGDYIEVPIDWTYYEFPLSGFAGETGHIAIQYVSEDAFFFMLDAITLDADVAPTEDYIYTITLGVEEGDVNYKYFSTVIGDGWDGGEWAGDPNRTVNVTEDLTVNDVFGVQPVGVVENELAEQGINLFPNPVSSTLYVENSELINELRIYDLTGRLVFSQVVNDNTTSINVSEFKTGVYIMQVMTVNGVASQKFNVR
jgi:uncharacterized surface protein with fasciclin (FAS1) repeats